MGFIARKARRAFVRAIGAAALLAAAAPVLAAPAALPAIPGLRWLSPSLEIVDDSSGVRIVAGLRGRFEREGWGLIVGTGQVVRSGAELRYETEVTEASMVIPIQGIGPYGEVRKHEVRIEVPKDLWARLEEVRGRGLIRLRLFMGGGPTLLEYREWPFDTVASEIGITLKGGLLYQLLPGKLDVGLVTYGTLVPIPLSSSPAGLPPARYLGVNLRVGYRLPFSSRDVSWTLSGGGYYWGMAVPGGGYGVSGLMGPQLLLSARVPSRNGLGTWSAYVKVAPLSDRPGTLTLKDRELAVGGTVALTSFVSAREWLLTADVSQVRAGSAETGNSMQLWTFSLGIQTTLFAH